MTHGLAARAGTLRFATAVAFLAVSLAAPLAAEDDERVWSVTSDGEFTAAADCSDCEEDVGVLLTCQSRGQPAEMTIYWAAVDDGVEGAPAEVVLAVDGRSMRYTGTTEYQGMVGYVPKLAIAPDDPLIERLSAGTTLRVVYAGEESDISLRGSRQALTAFATRCGWR